LVLSEGAKLAHQKPQLKFAKRGEDASDPAMNFWSAQP
jgi:hypothetical protein